MEKNKTTGQRTTERKIRILFNQTNIERPFVQVSAINLIFARMKKLLGFIFTFLMLLGACTPHPYPPSLQIVDNLASACPDSAIALLASLKDEMASAPEATRMYYRLLCVKADDKAYVTHTSDSVIRSVLHYYIEKDDKRHLSEAYYGSSGKRVGRKL